MHSAYSRRTSNHVFFRFPSRAAGAGERRDASAWSSRGALAGLGSENTSRVSRESSARSRTRSTSPARRPTGAGLQSASARRVFSRLRQHAFFGSSDAPTRDRASGGVDIHRATRARRGIGIAIRMGSAASPARARSHERPVACLTRRPPPPVLSATRDLKRDAPVCRFDRVFVLDATARIPDSSSSDRRPRFSAPSRQSTASWRRRERGRFPRF